MSRKIKQFDTFPGVIFLSSIQASTNKLIPLVSEIVQLNLNNLTIEDGQEQIEHWIEKTIDNTPLFLLVVDGINERNNFQWWGELLDALGNYPWRDKVATIITCRQEYWKRNSPCLNSLSTNTYQLPPYNERELEEALQCHNLSRSELSDALLPLISRPRYFDLVVKYREQILESGDITFERIILEDWKDRLGRKISGNRASDNSERLRS